MRKPFCPGQLVKLNAFAIECIVPANGGFKVMSEADYQACSFLYEEVITPSDVCLVIQVSEPNTLTNLIVLFGETLVRTSTEHLEPI